ncbi:MAG: hypothetical protein AAB036_08485 [Elusimicrobiota bacterium]
MNEILKQELVRQQEDARDKLFEAQYAFWNALLTVNGLTLAAFGVFYAASPSGSSYLVTPIIGASMISICLLVLNFVARKYMHERIYQFMSAAQKLTDEARKKDLRNTLWHHWSIHISETITVILFLIEVAYIAAFLWTRRGV